MSLYNAKSEGSSLRVTKFDADLNPEPNASYLTSATECTCPAGHRPTCRHRQMYPELETIANTEKFYHFEARRVVEPLDSHNYKDYG